MHLRQTDTPLVILAALLAAVLADRPKPCVELKDDPETGAFVSLRWDNVSFSYYDKYNDLGGGMFYASIIQLDGKASFAIQNTGDKQQNQYVVKVAFSKVRSIRSCRGPVSNARSQSVQTTTEYRLNSNDACVADPTGSVLDVQVAKRVEFLRKDRVSAL